MTSPSLSTQLKDAIDRLAAFKERHHKRPKPWEKDSLTYRQLQQVQHELERNILIAKLRIVKEKNENYLKK